MPLNEALAHYVVDVMGCPYVVCLSGPEGQIYARIGGSDVTYTGSMTYHVSESLSLNTDLCIHLRFLAGRSSHYVVEAEYKILACTLCGTIALSSRVVGMPSTKGALWTAGWSCSTTTQAACTP